MIIDKHTERNLPMPEIGLPPLRRLLGELFQIALDVASGSLWHRELPRRSKGLGARIADRGIGRGR